jgi:RecA-family ATPase
MKMKNLTRKVDDKTILDKFVEDFVKVIEKYCKYIIVSGFVAIAHGRSRGTEDIDMIIEKISKEKFIDIHNSLTNSGFECMQSDDEGKIYDDYLAKGDSIRYTKKGFNFAPPEMEIKLAKDELDNYQISTRQKLPFTKLDIYFSSIEMNIAFKEEYLKSDKDLEDARHLRIIYSNKIDEKEIKRIKE